MNEEKLKQLKWIWKFPDNFVLVPRVDIDSGEQSPRSKYKLMERAPFTYERIVLPSDIELQIVEILLEGGVKIINEVPDSDPVEVLWRSRKDEFVLVINPPSLIKWAIYHKPSRNACLLPGINNKEWLEICQKMIDAGVATLDEVPDKPIC
jgi:hypothetical protein